MLSPSLTTPEPCQRVETKDRLAYFWQLAPVQAGQSLQLALTWYASGTITLRTIPSNATPTRRRKRDA